MLDDRYGPNGDPPRLVGRKETSDYIGGMMGITMLVASALVIAGVLFFSAGISQVTRTAQYSHASKAVGPTLPASPKTQ